MIRSDQEMLDFLEGLPRSAQADLADFLTVSALPASDPVDLALGLADSVALKEMFAVTTSN